MSRTPPRRGERHKEREENFSPKGQNPFFPCEEQPSQSRCHKQEPTSDQNPLYRPSSATVYPNN